MKTAIIMPVLNPDHKMTDFLDSLLEAGFKDIIIVNDGSKAETVHHFEEAAKHPEVTVLTHEVNRGKGAGLKTAFSYLAANRPDIDGAVTVDGDGQHDVNSINNCLAKFETDPHAMVIGGRDFDDPSVPPRSKAGNKISRVVYRFACGIKLNDTQTGLRVIPAEYFEKFSTLKGDRYEYETNMLIALVNMNIPYTEVPIKTIYIDDNASSHFNTFKDSFKIYKLVLANFFKFILASISSWLVDIGFFALTGLILDKFFPAVSTGYLHLLYDVSLRVIICTVVARVISSFFNFMINRKTVFKSTDNFGSTVGRYYILAVCQLLASMLLVDLFADKLLGIKGALQTVVKCVVDLILFLVSYNIQRKWVFKNKKA
ncbi:MAG: glycosyltransferase [Lachnospiraceae bacterium]|nr:glycosyltransferase [Lachnospiraceae bacterium]